MQLPGLHSEDSHDAMHQLRQWIPAVNFLPAIIFAQRFIILHTNPVAWLEPCLTWNTKQLFTFSLIIY